MKNIVNLTPHQIVMVGENEEVIQVIESSGVIPRVAVNREVIGEVNGYCINKSTFGEVEYLPEEKEDTIYIVSALVAKAAKKREDLVFPDETVRDNKGRIIGCKSFATI